MRTVLKAEPYRYGALGSFGTASHMLMRQYQFPSEYDPEMDTLLSTDHDRIFQQKKHGHDCVKKHTGTGDGGIGEWCQRVTPEKVISFLLEMLEADPTVNWTGFRILGTINRSNGYPVWTLQLFAKHPDSATKVQ